MPDVMQGDIIALKRLTTWKKYTLADLTCVVVTNEFKVLRKVSISQPDEESINFTQFEDGKSFESGIPKDIILEIDKVVGIFRRS